jgi:predicted amidohydrolase
MIEGEWLTLPRSVSVAQTCPVKGDVTANVDEHLRLIAAAKAEGAQVVVFPELSLTGYEIELASELAFSEHDSRLAPLAEAASSRTITLIVGAPVRIEARLHIAAFVFLPDGTQTLYTKHRLGAFDESARADGTVPPAEKTVFEPGDRNPLVRIGGNTAALAICADIGMPTHPRRAADRGVKAYLASMFVIPSAFNADSGTLCRYATQHSMVVALSNFGSPTGGLAAAGRSSIWSQKGDRLVELGPTGAGVAVATETSDGWHARIVLLDKP